MSKPVNEIVRFAHCANCAKMKPDVPGCDCCPGGVHAVPHN